METLIDWTKFPDPGVQHFSGAATYRNKFTLGSTPRSLVLDLGSVKEVAIVRVNGKEAGVLWKEPYRLDIAPLVRQGENQLEITVVNTWNNRIVGDLRSASVRPITRTNLVNKFNPNSPLLPSGLTPVWELLSARIQ